MALYDTAKQLVEDAEHRLLNSQRIPNPPVAWLRREFWHPLSYVFFGMDYFIKNFAKALFYVPLLMLLVAYISAQLGLPKDQTNTYLVMAAMFGLFVVLFALPSTFSHFQLKESDLDYLSQRILAQATSKAELEGLQAGLELMSECADNRVKTLRWALATIWAVFLFGFGQSLTILAKLGGDNKLGELLSGSILTFVVAVLLTLLPMAAIAGYRRANNMVFKGLQFACHEVALLFEKSEKA